MQSYYYSYATATMNKCHTQMWSFVWLIYYLIYVTLLYNWFVCISACLFGDAYNGDCVCSLNSSCTESFKRSSHTDLSFLVVFHTVLTNYGFCDRSSTVYLHPFCRDSFDRLIMKTEQGVRTVMILVNASTKDVLLQHYARVVHRHSRFVLCCY